MATKKGLAKLGLAIACLAAGMLLLILVGGWLLNPASRPSPEGLSRLSRSPAGWEIRYNATIALARRGSDKSKHRLDILKEMLNEEQQLQNFRARLDNGQEMPDETAARSTVLSALQAISVLHTKNPGLDLSELHAALDKLAASPNLVVRTEAERTRLDLKNK